MQIYKEQYLIQQLVKSQLKQKTLVIQRDAKEFNHAEVTEKIGWKLRVRKATTVPSSTIQTINATLKQASSERSKQLKQVGDEIFRPRLSQRTEVSLYTLGGFGQVGRSSLLLINS